MRVHVARSLQLVWKCRHLAGASAGCLPAALERVLAALAVVGPPVEVQLRELVRAVERPAGDGRRVAVELAAHRHCNKAVKAVVPVRLPRRGASVWTALFLPVKPVLFSFILVGVLP